MTGFFTELDEMQMRACYSNDVNSTRGSKGGILFDDINLPESMAAHDKMVLKERVGNAMNFPSVWSGFFALKYSGASLDIGYVSN